MGEAGSPRRFEVAVQREGRWIIDCLAASEQEALARADELYADETIAAVRVARGRFGYGGLLFESVVHERLREPPRGDPPVRIGRRPSEDAWCETLEEFYGPESRRAIARVLRNFLDRYAITPTELLHHHRYIRLLDRQEALGPQALQRMAALQAAARGVDARARLDALTKFADEAASRAKDALNSRAAPRLGSGGLNALADEVAATVPSAADRGFYLRFAISVAFESLGDPADKLAMALSWADGIPDALVPLVDEIIAGLLGAASLVQHLLGPQAHLASALTTLADLAQGRAAAQAPKLLECLARLVSERPMPESRHEILERITRELGGAKTLSRDDNAGQRRFFDELLIRLTGPDGLFLGGRSMVEAIARRTRQIGIVGGIDAVRFESETPSQRIDQILALAGGIHSDRQQQALATYLASLLDELPPSSAEASALQPRIAAAHFGEAAKATLLARLPPGVPAGCDAAA